MIRQSVEKMQYSILSFSYQQNADWNSMRVHEQPTSVSGPGTARQLARELSALGCLSFSWWPLSVLSE
jgi:hypothetical protein